MPRFTLEKYISDYCNIKTNTGNGVETKINGVICKWLYSNLSLYSLQSNKNTWSQKIHLTHISPKPLNLNSSFSKRKYFFLRPEVNKMQSALEVLRNKKKWSNRHKSKFRYMTTQGHFIYINEWMLGPDFSSIFGHRVKYIKICIEIAFIVARNSII